MRVLFINHANEDILENISNKNKFANREKNDDDNYDPLNFKDLDEISKCQFLGRFLKENDFDLKSIFSSNDPICLKTAEILSSYFKEEIELFVNLDLRDFNQNKEKLINFNKENCLNKFKFCEMNSAENIEKYSNVSNKEEW